MSRQTIEELLAVGFVGAANEKLRRLTHPSPDDKLALCETEAAVGSRAEAFAIADTLALSSVSASIRARALLVSGRIDLYYGRLSDGGNRFSRAKAIAAEIGDKDLVAAVSAAHVEALLRFVGLESASSHIAELRRVSLRSANPVALFTLHLLLAEAELKSGRSARALRELELSRHCLETVSEHFVREANLELVSSAVKGHVGDLALAQEHATRATELTSRAGAAALAQAARNNAVHLHVARGRFKQAAEIVERFDQAPSRSVGAELVDRSNQLALAVATGDIEAARELNNRLAPRSRELDGVQARWYDIVQTAFLIRAGEIDEATRVSLSSLQRLEATSDRTLLDRSRLGAAEALGAAGRSREAVDLVSTVALGPLGRLSELMGTSERVLALASRHRDTATAHLSRSARLFGHLGHVVGRGEALRDIAKLHTDDAASAAAADPIPHLTTFYSEAPRSFGRADAPTFDSSERAAAHATHAAAALVDLMSRPSLAGYELLQLASASGASRSAVLLALSESGAEPIGWTGTDTVDTALLTPSDQWVSVDLGADRGVEHRAVFRPADQGPARIVLLSLQRLVASARSLHASIQAESEKSALWPEQLPEQQLGLVCASESMLELLSTARRIAASNIPVLITGETGTGKELLGKAIHQCSARQRAIFLPFNCTAVPKDMLDSQLFGYRRGAFTGAHDAFKGIIRNAAGGTLFLDEIGEIGLDLQPKLLRFLESNEVHPLGEAAPVPVDVRIVAATNANLDRMVADGTFREDLFYRLNVVRLTIPPLRERREEIPLLIDHFMERAQKEAGKTGLRLADATSEYLLLYGWPGNVRELSNEVRRLVALAESDAVLMPEHLSPKIAATRRTVPAAERPADVNEFVVRRDQPLSAAIEHVERTLIQDALRATGSVDLAAKMLGLSRKGLYLKRQRLKIED